MPVNLVFQGGGVRGIAYAGVLETRPPAVSIRAVAGTSAGAIVAALIAIGKPVSDVKAILRDTDLLRLLDPEDTARGEAMKKAWAQIAPIINEAMTKGKISAWRSWRGMKQVRSLMRELGVAWGARGLHSSDRLGQWLRQILEDKTFADATAVDDVKIVAADVSRQQYQIYTKASHAGTPLAQAVHASASIPIFFHPFETGTDLLVDGGILSNFPAFLFAASKYPTIGFRLRDLTPSGPITHTLEYLKAVLQTMAEAHDKQRPLPRHVFLYEIITPPEIPFDKFALTPEELNRLLDAGKQVGDTVRWKEHEQHERAVSFFDPKADETLEYSVSQARALYDAFADQQSWADDLTDEVELTVRIDRDWTTTYDRRRKMAVRGNGGIFLTRYRAEALPQDELRLHSFSLMDVRVTTQEQTANGLKDLIRVPAYNSEKQKGFVLFYTPPISERSGPRTFLSTYIIAKEFVRVPEGEPGTVSYGVQRLAKNHGFRLSLRILTDTELPRLVFSSDFGKQPTKSVAPQQVGPRYYTEHRWDVDPAVVTGEAVYNVHLRIDRS